jgi:hypothetical protein
VDSMEEQIQQLYEWAKLLSEKVSFLPRLLPEESTQDSPVSPNVDELVPSGDTVRASCT